MVTNVLIAGLLLVGSFMALALAHAFPWRIIPPLVNARNELHAVAAYVVGVSIMLIIFALWCLLNPEAPALAALAVMVIISVGSGLGTTLPRIIKALDATFEKARQASAYERRIKEIENERPDSQR